MKLLHHLRAPSSGEVLQSTPLGSKIIRYKKFRSAALKRKVVLDVFLPPGYLGSNHFYPILILNDGQDLKDLHLVDTLDRLYQELKMEHIIAVGVHAGNRLSEYGTSSRPDYLKRGAKARAYTKFLVAELLPFTAGRYRALNGPRSYTIAGCSLGGLSALDISWHHPEIFGKVGVFSGSFWWRSKAYEKGYDDARDRIMHQIIRESSKKEGLKLWFQTGTKDEECDRNNSGIIDSIEDTVDLIEELKRLGYDDQTDINYLEIEGGEHNFKTWAIALPKFLTWAFSSQNDGQLN